MSASDEATGLYGFFCGRRESVAHKPIMMLIAMMTMLLLMMAENSIGKRHL
ncbi:MAG: hypothetical protein WCB11_22055 [Terriglobales bacterium]